MYGLHLSPHQVPLHGQILHRTDIGYMFWVWDTCLLKLTCHTHLNGAVILSLILFCTPFCRSEGHPSGSSLGSANKQPEDNSGQWVQF